MRTRPHILIGETGSREIVARLQACGWGRMYVEKRPQPYDGERWGFDNGAFLWWVRGLPFDEHCFLRRLEIARKVDSTPYLAVAPDIVAGGLHSLDFSMKWRSGLPGDWPWYLAVQDGMEASDVEPVLDRFAGIFLGGSDRFKSTAWRWRRLAHKHALRFHYGRAGTPAKLKSAFKVGSDSCDSAFPLWNRERMTTFFRQWENLENQYVIPEALHD